MGSNKNESRSDKITVIHLRTQIPEFAIVIQKLFCGGYFFSSKGAACLTSQISCTINHVKQDVLPSAGL